MEYREQRATTEPRRRRLKTGFWPAGVEGLPERSFKLELLLLRIETYGPSAVYSYRSLFEWTARHDRDAHDQIRGALVEYGWGGF